MIENRYRGVARCVATLAVASLLALPASAINFNWNVTGPADWNVGTNWDPEGPPSGGGGNHAFVNNGGIAEINADIPDITDIFVAAGAGTSGTLNQTDGATFQGTGSRMFVGQDGGTGVYNLSGGTQNKAQLYVGRNAAGNGTLNLSGTGVAGGDLLIAGVAGGTATVNITETGSVNTTGNVEFQNAQVTIADDALIQSGDAIWFGNGGSNSTTAEMDSGTAEADTWIAIGRDSSTGVVNLSGDATLHKLVIDDGDPETLSNSEASFIVLGSLGMNGSGMLNVMDSATVVSDNGMVLGENSNNSGVVHQSGGTVTVHDWTPNDDANQPMGFSLVIGNQTQGGAQNTGNNAYNLSGGELNAETIVLNQGQFNKTGGVLNFTSFEMNGGTLSADTLNGSLAQNGGTVSPGDSPGTMTIMGDYSLNSGDLAIEIDGLAPGTEYDQLIVTGDVSLAGDLTLASTLSSMDVGELFTIVDNQGANPVSGNFTGLPEGATLGSGGMLFSVSYLGGDGNNVVLTSIPEPASITLLTIALAGCYEVVRRRHGY